MAVRLYSEFKSDRGDQYKIEIHDTQWLAVSTAFNVTGSGFQLTYEGETDDIVSPVVGSKLSFGGYSTNSTFETFVNTLKSFQENRFRIVVYRAAVSDVVNDFESRVYTDGGTIETIGCVRDAVTELGLGAYELFWTGWIVQDLVTIEDESQPYVYQFTATDGIGRLSNIDYDFNNDDPAGLTRVTGILENCLSLVGTDDLWPAGETYVRTSVDWWETTSQTYATNKDTLQEHGIDVRVFTTEDDDGNTIYTKAFDVLKQLAITYGARVYQTNGHWVFEQYVNRSGVTRYVTNYDKTMTSLGTIAVNDDVTIDQTSGYARLTGGQFNYLPAVGSVSVEYVQEKFSSTSKPITFRSTAPTKILGIIGASTSTQLKFYGPHNYNITSSSGATTNDGTIAVVWRLQIRIESATTPGLFYYYNRAFNGFASGNIYGNAAWSTTAGYYYYHAPFGKVIFGALSLNSAPVVITANLPTSGTLRITSEHFGNYNPIDGTAYTLEPHQLDTWSTTLTIARMDNANDNSSSITYRANNANANVDSNIELNLGTTRIANGLFQTGDLSVYNGTSWTSGLAFRRGSTGSGDQILNLLVREMLGLHAAPIQRFNGQMFNDAMIENRLAFDGARYLNIGGTFTAREGHFSAEWFLIDYDPASVGTLDAERQPVEVMTSGGSNVGNYDGVIEVGRIAGMAVDATQEKIGPFEQTASGGKIDGTLDVVGNAVFDSNVQVDGDTTIVGTIDVTDLEVSNDLSVTGATTLGGLSAGTTTLGASTIGSAVVTGNTSVGGTLGVTGTSTLGTLNAGTSTLGASTLSSASVTGNTSVGGTLGVTGTATLGTLNAAATSVTTLAASSNTTIGGTLGVTGKSTLGTLEAGTSTLGAATLASSNVTGNQTIGGTLGVTGASTLGTLNAGASTLGSASVTGNTSVGGTLGVTGTSTLGTLNAAATSVSTLAASSNATIGGTLGVTGKSTLGTLEASTTTLGASTLASASVTGNQTIGGTLGVTGTSTLGTLSAGASTLGSASVTGNTSIGGTLGVTGTATLGTLNAAATSVTTLAASSNASVGGTLGVTGASTLGTLNAGASTLSSAAVTGNQTIGGTLGVTGASTLGTLNAAATSVSTLSASSNATIGGTLGVTGVSTLGTLNAGTSTLGASTLSSASVTGNQTIGGTLGVTGTSTLGALNAGTTTLGASTIGSATITGNASVGGTTTLANVTANDVTAADVVLDNVVSKTAVIGTTGLVDAFRARVFADGGTFEAFDEVVTAVTELLAGGSNKSAVIYGETNVQTLAAEATSVTTLSASSNATIGGTLGVTGATTLAATLNVAGRTSTEYVQLDTTFVPNGEPAGAFYWDPDAGVAAIRGIDGISLDLNEKEIWYVKNQTGATINAGTAVYAAGTLGSSGQILIGKMIANGTINAKFFLGITQSAIDNGGDGYVVRNGKIRQINTTAWNDGDVLYVDETTAGALSDTEPTAPNLKLPVAFVVNSASNGTIAVRSTAGSYLAESHDVQIDSPVENEILARTAEGRWENVELGSLLTTTTEKPNATEGESFTQAFGGNAGTIMGEPDKWLPITIGGVNYLMPLYLLPS